MIEALTFEQLEEYVKKNYSDNEQRVVGIMLANYTEPSTKEIIDQRWLYWHNNTAFDFDIFWPGYGAYLFKQATPCQRILEYQGNERNTFFDIQSFVATQHYFNDTLHLPYQGGMVLFLVDCHAGNLDFAKALRIELELSDRPDHMRIRRIMEIVTTNARLERNVSFIKKELRIADFKNYIKKPGTINGIIKFLCGILGLF